MFLPVQTKRLGLRPDSSKISQSDWEILSRFWYPVARVVDVGDGPFSSRLLDVDLVLYRSAGGLTAALDMCPHRWVKLSVGKVSEGRIICPYHALGFDGTGRCVSAPGLGPDAQIPENYRIRTFRAQLKYGLVWVCLADDSEAPLPAFPALDGYDDSAIEVLCVWRWPVSAPRQIENFIDLAHLPFVHENTIGGYPDARVEPFRIEHRDASIMLTGNVLHTALFEEPTDCAITHEIFLPFSIEFSCRPEGGEGFKVVNLASPSSAYTCLVFELQTHGLPGEIFEGQQPWSSRDPHLSPGAINQQDVDLLQHLQINDFPLSQSLEFHLPADNVSTAYRQRLRKLGLGRTQPGEFTALQGLSEGARPVAVDAV